MGAEEEKGEMVESPTRQALKIIYNREKQRKKLDKATYKMVSCGPSSITLHS